MFGCIGLMKLTNIYSILFVPQRIDLLFFTNKFSNIGEALLKAPNKSLYNSYNNNKTLITNNISLAAILESDFNLFIKIDQIGKIFYPVNNDVLLARF